MVNYIWTAINITISLSIVLFIILKRTKSSSPFKKETQNLNCNALRWLSIGIVIIDQKKKIVFWNNTAEILSGYKEDEVKGQIYSNFFLPVIKKGKEILEKDFEGKLLLKSGGFKYIKLHSTPDIKKDNNQYTFFAFMETVANHQLQEELRTFYTGVEQSPACIVITDPNGYINYVNQSFEVLTGYSKLEALGETMRIVRSDYHDKVFYKELWTKLENDGHWEGEFRNKKKDNSLYWEKAHIASIETDGERVGYIAIKNDITKEKQLEEFKEHIEHIVRHDLKSPLTAIMGFPQILLEDKNLTEEQVELIAYIREAGEIMLNQINFSLELYKLEKGNFKPRLDHIDLLKVIHKNILYLQHQLEAKSVQITFSINDKEYDTEEKLYVQLDKNLLFSIVGNILKNAVEAVDQDDSIDIEVSSTNAVVINIRNDGLVPKEIRNNFFDKFASYGKPQGTGLGTYSSRLFTNALGGTISFSTSILTGTTLTVEFPKTILD